MKALALLIITGLLFTACASPPAYDATADTAMQTMVDSCRKYNYAIDSDALSKYQDLDQTSRAYALMHRETMSMIKATFGKDPCSPGSTQWDAWVAYYNAHAKEFDSGMNVLSTGLYGLAAYGITKEVISAVSGASINVTGDSNTIEGVNSDYSNRQYQTNGQGDNTSDRSLDRSIDQSTTSPEPVQAETGQTIETGQTTESAGTL
jgi:hypothetical protein